MFEIYGKSLQQVEIRWPCSSRWPRAAGLHHARHAVRSASGLLQREFALRMIGCPIGPEAFPYTALRPSAVGLRTVGSHKTGTCLAQIFIGAEDSRFAGWRSRLSCLRAVEESGFLVCAWVFPSLSCPSLFPLPPFRPILLRGSEHTYQSLGLHPSSA